MNWIQALARLDASGTPHVLVSVIAVEGSAPRAEGTKMIVSRLETHDTIGGGHLEYQAIETARSLLAQFVKPMESLKSAGSKQTPPSIATTTVKNHSGNIHTQSVQLGKQLSQCCGGRVELMYELLNTSDQHIALFGAGHVGQALITLLAELPFRVTWYDSRAEYIELAQRKTEALVASRVSVCEYQDPYPTAQLCESGSAFVIMTHSHEIDMELCESVLSRPEFVTTEWCGLIASDSKARSFKSRLKRKGFGGAELEGLCAPIGHSSVGGKEPMAVAISVAAQLLAIRESGVLAPTLVETGL